MFRHFDVIICMSYWTMGNDTCLSLLSMLISIYSYRHGRGLEEFNIPQSNVNTLGDFSNAKRIQIDIAPLFSNGFCLNLDSD